MEQEKAYEVGTGNVFEDIGLNNPQEYLLRAKLAKEIVDIINSKKMTQKQAGEMLTIDPADISRLKSGDISRFTVDRLFKSLNRLGQDISINIAHSKKEVGGIYIDH